MFEQTTMMASCISSQAAHQRCTVVSPFKNQLESGKFNSL